MLITLQDKVQDNMQSIQSNLSGNANGPSGLVYTPEANLTVVPTAESYIRPHDLGRLEILKGLKRYQIAQACN